MLRPVEVVGLPLHLPSVPRGVGGLPARPAPHEGPLAGQVAQPRPVPAAVRGVQEAPQPVLLLRRLYLDQASTEAIAVLAEWTR